jgi:hypothetical protein
VSESEREREREREKDTVRERESLASTYRGTSPIRKRPPAYDPHMTPGTGLR